MRFDSFTILLAGLASLTAAVSLAPASDTSPDMEHYSGYDPAPASIAAHLEGLAGCYARCMLDQNKYFNNDLARFTFHDFCGFYWKAVIMWEYDRVRGCALLHCMEEPCKVRADNCDVPGWIYQAHRYWLIEHCKGIRDVASYGEPHIIDWPGDTDPW